MDLLITLIGNAAVDPGFRELFLDNPLRTADEYGFRLTKGDFQIMTAMFTRMDDDERARVEAAFKALEDILYAKMNSSALSAPPPNRPPCTRPCSMSIYPPPGLPELREIIDKQAA